jgi:hypothetical protein
VLLRAAIFARCLRDGAHGDADIMITVQAYAGDVMVAQINAHVLVGDGII